MKQRIEQEMRTLFEAYTGCVCLSIDALPVSGSSRKYFRLSDGENSVIAVYHRNLRENQLFVTFSRHFLQKGLHVPEIYSVSEDGLIYLQQDLGNCLLLDVVNAGREGARLSECVIELYRKALSELLRFQLQGGKDLNYADCLPRPVFDARCVAWDLNYFKYCFLKLAGVDVDENLLEDDFERLNSKLCSFPANHFMFRDLQSRNIMIQDDEVYFIDYQGGRQGALFYDVGSLLYDAIVAMPDDQRELLLDFYIDELRMYEDVSADSFKEGYYHFVLIRLLQAMGAFGLRGLHERKQHFIDSVIPGLESIVHLLDKQRMILCYPEIEEAIKKALNIFR